MANEFIDRLKREVSLADKEESLLLAAGIRSSEELLSLVWNFPSLGQNGHLNIPRLSEYAVRTSNARFVSSSQRQRGSRPILSRGASYPSRAPAPSGWSVPLPSITGGGEPPKQNFDGPFDLRPPNWPIRDQGDRGTCVAFAIVACREYREYQNGSDEIPDLSEQFMYWATKTLTGDPSPDTDGSLLRYAQYALQHHGVCIKEHWPYDRSIRDGDVTHATSSHPSETARREALTWCCSGNDIGAIGGSGAASTLYDRLVDTQQPVAISLPVFFDAPDSDSNNWNAPICYEYGSVLDPPPTSIATGEGHAICVVGFVPDQQERTGGFFLFRNSWGTEWAQSAPAVAPFYSPMPGYGQVSATYVDEYLWEGYSL